MSPFTESMYGVGGTRVGRDWLYSAGDPILPLGPDIVSQNDWWFRGPAFRALAPPAGAVTALPAGGSITIEIACHVAWTSFGWRTSVPGSKLDACPDGGNAGMYHSNEDPTSDVVDLSLLSGCALAIADVDDIEKTTMDNLVIFSVQSQCVLTKETTFDVPAMMPACTGKKCICGWFWLANTGASNFYMTAFDCNVTSVNPAATALAAPVDPIFCMPGDTSCVPASGAKRPLYAYNSPTNCEWTGDPALFNANRPGYHASYSFKDGAQNDIFVAADQTTPSATTPAALSTPVVKPTTIKTVLLPKKVGSKSTRIAAVGSPHATRVGAKRIPKKVSKKVVKTAERCSSGQ